ncbi:hypothetical protein SIN8267_01302 [Sinobacterium norvegicum]|uniref:DUF1254 domain-containing protein n=1 Tax=Sinobacterium norvegicum TaxID=1641715 RepID=A0ABM9ADC2_9GAMM|nr:DUF1254 domain-containing protein [Sinobacterium norvegicum]CAH0991200.1 hypothetical protein SIN8267_01302 [Sinobacterium norvegicum]
MPAMLKRSLLVLMLLVVALLALVWAAKAPIKKAVEMYFYAYPLVLMEQTHLAMGGGHDTGPVNRFDHIRAFPDASFTAVIRPNNDTLYSSAWYDVSEQPMVLSVPDMGDRYFMFPIMDMWTEVVASIGSRTTGQAKGDFLLVAQGWQGEVVDGLQVVELATDKGWIIGRTFSEGNDFAVIHPLQNQYQLRTVTDWQQGNSQPPSTAKTLKCQDCLTPPALVASWNTATFYQHFAALLQRYPGHQQDEVILADLSRLGINGEGDFDFDNLASAQQWLLQAGAVMAKRILRDPPLPEPVDGWSIPLQDIGRYGINYAKRAVVANIGLGANEPADAVYPMSKVDSHHQPYDGSKHYKIHFGADQIPPVNGFWSLTMYDENGYFVNNVIDRYSLGSRDSLHYNSDGSVDILLQHQPPSTDQNTNWLPAPAGAFTLTMRLYWPDESVLTGHWYPPLVVKQ